jgi:pyridoxal phosphate enzyme (YggS family)
MPDVPERMEGPAAGRIAARLDSVRVRIARAAEGAGRDPAAVRLIAVTKTVAPPSIAEAVAAGVVDVGENRVQEARLKHAGVPLGIRWHLIGHLQSNKAALAAELFDTVHSLDSRRVGAALAGHRAPGRGPLQGLLEVDFTGIPGRTGVPPEAAAELLKELTGHPGLSLVGLMTIAPFGDPATARDCFRRLRELRDRLREELGVELPELSMGMSDDFEIAIAEGATMVRLGRVIFGERPAAAAGGSPAEGVGPPG